MSEDMLAKASNIVKKREISYMQTNGNMHIFTAKAHADGETGRYMITAKLQFDKPILWDCECKAFEYSKDDPQICKHIIAGKEVLKKERLRKDYHLAQDTSFIEAQEKLKASEKYLADIDSKIEFAGSDLY